MKRKEVAKRTACAIVLVVVVMATLVACGGGGLAGTTWSAGSYTGGTFIFGNNTVTFNGGNSLSGVYEVHGNTVMLMWSDGSNNTLTRDGDTMTLKGVTYKKQ